MFFNQFSEYRKKIIFPEEKTYFDEITKLFSSKQYRSAYIMTWVMLIEALRHRITLLADSGESFANKLISKIEKMEEQKMSVDKEVIDGAKALSLIEKEDFGYFDQFWTKRCLYVHPYSKKPSKAEVETIIKISVDKILSNSAFYRKAFIESEIKNIYVKHYLPNIRLKIEKHIAGILPRIDTSLYPFFFKSVLAEIGENISIKGKDDALDKFAIYLQTIYIAASEENKKNNFRIDYYVVEHPEEFVFGLTSAKTWNLFNKDLKNRIIMYVSENIRNKNYDLKSNKTIIRLIVDNVIEPGECR